MSFCGDAASFGARPPLQTPASACWHRLVRGRTGPGPRQWATSPGRTHSWWLRRGCWYNLRHHLAELALASVSRLCFWVMQSILLTTNSFCSTLTVSQRERDHYKPERPHRANFTFDYRPSAALTLNQRELRNTGSALSSESNACLSSPIAPRIGVCIFFLLGFCPGDDFIRMVIGPRYHLSMGSFPFSTLLRFQLDEVTWPVQSLSLLNFFKTVIFFFFTTFTCCFSS